MRVQKRKRNDTGGRRVPRRTLSLIMVICLLVCIWADVPPAGSTVNADEPAQEEVLDNSVTAGAKAAVDDAGDTLTEALTGESLKATLYAYNDNPNADAAATVRFYVKQTAGTADVTASDESITEAEDGGWSWHEPGEYTDPDDGTVTNSGSDPDSLYPYIEVTVKAGESVAAELLLSCATGYDSVVSAYIYIEADVAADNGSMETVDLSGTDPLTFVWTGSCVWDNFEKTVDVSAVGIKDRFFTSSSLNYSYSSENLASGNAGIIYTDSVTLTDTFVLPEAMTCPDDIIIYTASSKYIAAVSRQTGPPVFYIYYTGSCDYVVNYVEARTNADGLMEVSYSLTVYNPDPEDTSFNPVSDISASLYLISWMTQGVDSSLYVDAKIDGTATLTVNSVEDGNPTIYEGSDDAVVMFDSEASYTLNKSVYQVRDGLGKVTYGYGLDTMTPSDEKVSPSGVPYVAQDYTVTYRLDIGSTYSMTTTTIVKDSLPAGVSFDADSVSVKGGTLASVSQGEDTGTGGTVVSMSITIPADTAVSVYYDVVIGDAGTTANATITNTASTNEKTASAVVMTPLEQKSTIEKEIVRRTTTLTTGETISFYRIPVDGYPYNHGTSSGIATADNAEYFIYINGSVSYIGDLDGYAYYVGTTYNYDTVVNLYFGTRNITAYMIRDAMLEVNAGDEIEYVITYENNSLIAESFTSKYMYIYDYPIFSTATGGGVWDYYDFIYRNGIGGKAVNWSYQQIYSDFYCHKDTYTTGSASGDVASENYSYTLRYGKLTSTTYNDFVINTNSYDESSFRWKFDRIYAYTTYRQTIIVSVPGNNSVSSASSSNVVFQDILSAYAAYHCDFTTNFSAAESGWDTLASYYKPQTQSGANLTIAEETVCSEEIRHTTARQLYLNTGTLASMTVNDADNISDKDVYANWSNGIIAANNYDASAKYFNADENSVAVNYIYLFNDSPDEMYLDDYKVSIGIPEGFEWVGFTYQIYYDSNRYYSAPSSTIALKNYYNNGVSLYVDYTRYGNSNGSQLSTSAFSWFSSGSAEGYFSGTEDYVNTASKMSVLGTSAQSYLDDPSTPLKCDAEKSGNSVKLKFLTSDGTRPSIDAYSGIVVMYMAKVSDADKVKELYSGNNNAATFSACITQTYETVYVDSSNYNHVAVSGKNIAQVSPVIHACDVASGSWALTTTRQYVCNDGNPNTFLEHQLDRYYAGGTGCDGYDMMWSYASLSVVTEKTSVSVEKEVVKNSGSDYAGQYSNGVTNTGSFFYNQKYMSLAATGGFASGYDDYNGTYALTDGVHATVDGTVTWKVSITNTGQDTSGNTATSVSVGGVSDYQTVSYSTIVETVDSPYHLVEIAVPENIYLYYDASTGYTNKASTYKWSYYELPDADPSDKGAMTAAGWTYDEKTDSYFLCAAAKAAGNAELDDLTKLNGVQYPYLTVRVTVKCLEGGSLTQGADAGSNTDAYQYTVEFLENLTGTAGLSISQAALPVIPTADMVTGSTTGLTTNRLELYFTFSTDDSIVTNYNSVGLVIKDADEDGIEVKEGEFMTLTEMHGGANADEEETETTYYNKTTAGSPGTVAADAPVVQASDWTDTSYTDGEKTLKVTDGNGDTVSVSTKSGGDMTLPDSVEPGSLLHNTLRWDSLLYEAENYTSIDGLAIYDLYGVESDASSPGDVMYAYDVDFSSIVVTLYLSSNASAGSLLRSSSVATVLTLGVDYDIYYTTVPLVTGEHHEITVNTLYYAADYGAMESADWILYDPDDPDADGTGAMAFKIVLKGSTVGSIENGRLTGNSAWTDVSIAVDYDATVASSVEDGMTYPSVMAWTGTIVQETEDDNGGTVTTYKSLQEDTSATLLTVENDYPILTKKLVDGDGSAVSGSGLFTFLILRTDRTSDTGSVAASDITGAALATAGAGKTILLNDGNLQVIYNGYDTGDGSAAGFWDNDGYLYYVIEVGEGDYSTSSVAASGASSSGSVKALSVGTGISTIDTYLAAADGKPAAWFAVEDSSTLSGTIISCTNVYTAPDLVITKADASNEIILNEVSFTLADSSGNGIVLSGSSGAYAYEGTGTATEITFSGTATVSGLPEGTYTLTETEAPDGYVAGAAVQVTVSADGASPAAVEVTVINTEEPAEGTGTLAVTKADSVTGLTVTESEASFAVFPEDDGSSPLWFLKTQEGSYYYCESGTPGAVQSLTTYYGELSVEGLPYGTYYLAETDAPDGYLMNDESVKFTVSRSDSSEEITFKDEPISGTVYVTKTDTDGSAITDSAATFVLYGEDGEAVTFTGKAGMYGQSASGKDTELLTSSAGTLTLSGLPEGTYYLEETDAPEGYALDGTQHEITISDNEPVEITVEDEKLSLSAEFTKLWRSEGGTKTYAFEGVEFILYKADGDTAAEAARGTTGEDGFVGFTGLDWEKTYYLYEEVPEGYSADYDVTVYRNDSTGELDLSMTAATAQAGYTAIQCLVLDFASLVEGGSPSVTEGADGLAYTAEIVNVKLNTSGGLYASTSYKTVSNAATAAEYDLLSAETGYSYYYTEDDYLAGNYNYVHAANAGDTVTYTLNVTNASDYGFYGISLIDRMPETGDTGIVNSSASRGSEFAIVNPADIRVCVDGKELDSDEWSVSYSTKVKFTDGDFNGATTWDATAAEAASFRVLMSDDFILEPGQTLTVSYNGTIGDDTEIGETAWNNFAYRYTAGTGSSALTLTPEPPKVGVEILGQDFSVEKVWDDNGDELKLRPDGINVTLVTTDGTNSTPVSSAVEITEADGWKHAWTGLRLLKSGLWYSVEEESISGYTASVSVDGGTSAVLTNTARKGSITVIKKDADGNVLEGAGFTLYDADGNTVSTAETGKDGTAVFEDLVPGIYRLTETKSPDGYALLADGVKIKIPYSMTDADVTAGGVDTSDAVHDTAGGLWYFYDLTYTVTDAAVMNLPETGTSGGFPVPAAAGILLLLAAGAACVIRQKRKLRQVLLNVKVSVPEPGDDVR